VRITYDTGTSIHPSVVAIDSIVLIVWFDFSLDSDGYGYGKVSFVRSTDYGETWSSKVVLVDEITGAAKSDLSVFHYENSIYIVFLRNPPSGKDRIVFVKSEDYGITWSSPYEIKTALLALNYPNISAWQDNIHVVFLDNKDSGSWYEVYYMRSTDGGNSWSSATKISNVGEYFPCTPAVAASGSYVHVVWSDESWGRFYQVYYRRSEDGGMTWDPVVRLTSDTLHSVKNPYIYVENSNVYIFYHKYGIGDIFYMYSNDNGENWSSEIRLTDAISLSDLPSVTGYQGILHVLWYDTRDGNPEIYYKNNSGTFVKEDILFHYDTYRFQNIFMKNMVFPYDLQKYVVIYSPAGRNIKNKQKSIVLPGIYFLRFKNAKPLKIIKLD